MENKTTSIYKNVISKNDNSDELKVQYTIDLTPWDTSTMDGYTEGTPVKTGFSCKFATLKPSKKFPRQVIFFDPADPDLRKSILDMYSALDRSLKKE